MQPQVALVVVGAGNDALPVVDMAAIMGWHITVVDGRSTHANQKRFAKAHQIIVAKPGEAFKQLAIDGRTVFILMTHNFNYDLAMLEALLRADCSYIGTLGPRSRLERLVKALQEQGCTLSAAQMAAIYGPTGLDIGAEAPEEIALSILAEIKAVLAGRPATSLRNRLEGIHAPFPVVSSKTLAEPGAQTLQ